MGYAPQSKENSNPQHLQHSTKATTPTFADERESTTAISPLQAMMANSPQQQKLKSTAQLMANSPAQQRLNTTAQTFATKPEPIQRLEDEEPLQAKADEPVQREQAEAPPESSPPPKPNNTGLPDNLKTGIENLSGMSMDHVKVHFNSDKPAQLQAHAYAQGSEIHVAPGQEQHLPHEAWHVVQQAQGRVKPTVQMKGGVGVNDDVGLEREADLMGSKALQMKRHNEGATDLTATQRRENSAATLTVHPSAVLQCRELNLVEREKLADAKKRFSNLKEQYETHKALMDDALTKRGGFGDTLSYFQSLGWGKVGEEIAKIDEQFNEMIDLERRAISNHKPCGEFIAKVNFYDHSGGMNRFYNIYKDMEGKLLSTERNHNTQFTEMDEVAFQKYLLASKSPVIVYRGAGWGELNEDTFNSVAFGDIAAGGTRDISFRGVVEHTWENNKKNGMVSCTTSIPIALGFATDSHTYGIVWKLSLDNYIHVTNHLKTRNWKYRFPGQFEVLYPGSISGAKIVSMTLYHKKTPVKTRTP